MIKQIQLYLGIGRNTTSHGEKLLSALGGSIGICLVILFAHYWVAQHWLSGSDSLLVVSSIGASAVLLFAVPHGALSQPWALLAGHGVSAIVGVACYQVLGASTVSGGLAVGLAIGAMYYLRCIHPPGGATALTAVLGSADLHNLGFHFALIPILGNALILCAVAIVFNLPFSWRRYPAHLGHVTQRKANLSTPAAEREIELTQEDFAAAMQALDSFVDITSEGLTELLELAKLHAEKNITHPHEIVAGKFYSNGKLGKLWSVRQVVDAATAELPSKDKVIYKVVAGAESYITGICLREEFRRWARYEVENVEQRWIKVDAPVH